MSRGTGMRAVNVATSQRGGTGENDVLPEHHIEEFSSALAGYTLLHLSGPVVACTKIEKKTKTFFA